MTKLTLTEQEELFARDCKLINLKYEYTGYTGKEKWAIVSELSPVEIKEKYFLIIGRYSPFVYLSIAQGEIIDKSYRNNHKYEMRMKRTTDVYGYDDELSSQFHEELSVAFEDPFERAEIEKNEYEKERMRDLEIEKVRKILSLLQPSQRRRLIKFLLEGKSYRQIAEEEGTYHSSVGKSVDSAIKNFIKFYGNL